MANSPNPMEYAQNPYAGKRKEKDGNAGLVNSSGRVIIVDPVLMSTQPVFLLQEHIDAS